VHLVLSVMQRQPTSGEVFVFLNRSRTHIKLLHWESGGFVLYYKRLEQGTFGASELKKGELSWSDLVLMVADVYIGDCGPVMHRYIHDKVILS